MKHYFILVNVIYVYPDDNESIRQGDIFINIPRIEISLDKMVLLNDDNIAEPDTWAGVIKSNEHEPVSAVLPIKPVPAIVVSQDCDAENSRDITLCEIKPITDIFPDFANAKKPGRLIVQQTRKNVKWFYLPPDDRIGFENKMGVDFMITLRVPLEDLKKNRLLRRARLNEEADEHFRERLSEFYRRYPYDEWYPLNHAEFTQYQTEYPNATPRAWQKASNNPSSI